jgi:hypothetical protein
MAYSWISTYSQAPSFSIVSAASTWAKSSSPEPQQMRSLLPSIATTFDIYENVIAFLTVYCVHTATTVYIVDAGPPRQLVSATFAVEPVSASETTDNISATQRVDRVIAIGACEAIGAIGALTIVVAMLGYGQHHPA